MTIALTGSCGIFTRLGRLGAVAASARAYQDTTLPPEIVNILAQFTNTGVADEPDLVTGIPSAQTSAQSGLTSLCSTLSSVASATLTRMVFRDRPQVSGSTTSCLTELVRQMTATADSVKACTVAATPSSVTGTGNGILVASTLRGDGLIQQLIFPETISVSCSADSYSSGVTAGSETFKLTGAPKAASVWSSTYGQTGYGSGASKTLTAGNPTLNAVSGNLLRNSDFETFSAAPTPDNWIIAAGSAKIAQSTSTKYSGASSLSMIGDSSTLPSLSQTFNLSTGTTSTLSPDTVYVLAIWVKTSNTPAAGTLVIDLVDGTPTVITDDQGTANSLSINLATIGTTFLPKTLFIRTPKVMPATVSLRIRQTVALSTGTTAFLDHLSMVQAVAAYNGGPYCGVFSGSIPFVAGDFFSLAATNDYGGSSNLSTFQWLFERHFGLRNLGILLPYSAGSNTINDSLIS